MQPHNFMHSRLTQAMIFNILANWVEIFLMLGFLYPPQFSSKYLIILFYFIAGFIDLFIIMAINYFLWTQILKIRNMVLGHGFTVIIIIICQIIGVLYLDHLHLFQISLFSFLYGLLFMTTLTISLMIVFFICAAALSKCGVP